MYLSSCPTWYRGGVLTGVGWGGAGGGEAGWLVEGGHVLEMMGRVKVM